MPIFQFKNTTRDKRDGTYAGIEARIEVTSEPIQPRISIFNIRGKGEEKGDETGMKNVSLDEHKGLLLENNTPTSNPRGNKGIRRSGEEADGTETHFTNEPS